MGGLLIPLQTHDDVSVASFRSLQLEKTSSHCFGLSQVRSCDKFCHLVYMGRIHQQSTMTPSTPIGVPLPSRGLIHGLGSAEEVAVLQHCDAPLGE